jgi:molybdopterin molybdotransferase
LIPLRDARAWLESRVGRLEPEMAGIAAAVGRVLAEDLLGAADDGRVAGLDGRAVCAADTEGASEYAPLPVAGVPIVAGALMPSGSDAVLPPQLEDAAGFAMVTIPPGHGVAPADAAGLPAGTSLRPPHLALLARLGRDAVTVIRRPGITVRAAGPKSGREALAPMLAALIAAEGAEAATREPDLIIYAGRSGPGADDDGIDRFETVFAHGIAIQPGETTALGTIGGKTAILLPGDPLACATVFALLAAPALRRMAGRPEPTPLTVTLTRKIASALGQVDAVRVRVEGGRATPLSTLLSAGAGADGLVLAPEGSEGYPAGATVQVLPLP